jgi:hypothetical protein
MTAQIMVQRSNTQTLVVVVATAIALLIGWGLKGFVEGQTRDVTVEGIRAAVPAGWLVEQSSSSLLTGGPENTGLVFTAQDPLDPETRYLVSALPAAPDSDLAATAAFRNLQRAQDNLAYRMFEQTLVSLEGRDGYRVNFAFVDATRVDRAPVVYHGVDYYFAEGDQTIVITLETTRPLETALTAFRDFAAGVGLGE